MEDLWRWFEGLPARRDHATSVATLRDRAKRLETIDTQRDPAKWHNPAMSGVAHFEYQLAPSKTYTVGFGQFEFGLRVLSRGATSVYVYSDPIKAVGIARGRRGENTDAASYLTPARTGEPTVGDSVLLMNGLGALCWIDVLKIEEEKKDDAYRGPSIDFRFQLVNEDVPEDQPTAT